jgi:N,N-dimethylformamidase
MRVVGYTDRLSLRAGEAIQIKVSCEDPSYDVQMVRLIHGDENPRGPGLRTADVDLTANGRHEGHYQALHSGSYVAVDHDAPLRSVHAFAVCAWIFPTAIERGLQAILGAWDGEQPGYGLFVEPSGLLQLAVLHDGQRVSVRGETRLTERSWHFVAASFNPDAGTMVVLQRGATWSPTGDPSPSIGSFEGWDTWAGSMSPFYIGACGATRGTVATTGHFNGKIEAPTVLGVALRADELARLANLSATDLPPNAIARWDFSVDQRSRAVRDRSPHELHGRTVNFPTRAVTSHRHDGSSVSFVEQPDHYAAIHFHDDDLDDAGWTTDITLRVPADLQSGVYAARLSLDDGSCDYVPFFARPAPGAPRRHIVVLIPTFTYLAYANDHVAADPAVRSALAIGDEFVYPAQQQDKYVLAHGLTGMYDRHTDGTAVVYSSRLRPILNMRPTYRQPLLNMGRGGPHLLPADLHLVDWLEHFGHAFDVVTDEDVHWEGVDSLDGYRVVMTGTHPEYWTGAQLDALEAYLAAGGRLMYLGGNGLYWVTSVEPEEQHTIEVRKWGGSTPFEVPVGEVFHSTTGELGGVWRFRGRPPQRVVGVGMTAQGVDANAPYRLLPDSADPRVAFIFNGIDRDQLIGDHPCLVNEHGVGGYEIDRFDLDLGTPRHALRIATTTGLSDWYQHVREEVPMSDSKQSGTVNDKVRADMVYFECPNGGAVWSVGSIAWCAGLSYNGYDNAVSRITRNVLTAFTNSPTDSGRIV